MFYKILQGSKQAELARKAFNCTKDWFLPEAKSEIEELLGVPIKCLYLTDKNLLLSELPYKKKRQFERHKNRNGYYRAKSDSELCKQYKMLCKKYNLINFSIMDFSLKTGVLEATGGMGGNSYYCFNDTYYIETACTDLSSKLNWVTPVEEDEFYLLKRGSKAMLGGT